MLVGSGLGGVSDPPLAFSSQYSTRRGRRDHSLEKGPGPFNLKIRWSRATSRELSSRNGSFAGVFVAPVSIVPTAGLAAP
eukprot:8839182-Pyramimonas_sp.AAC.1